MDILSQSALSVGLLSFAVGISSLVTSFRNKLFISFGLSCLLISAWEILYFLSAIWPEYRWYGWHLSMTVWMIPAVLLFMQNLLRIENKSFSKFLYYLSLTLCAGLSVILILGLEKQETLLRFIIYYSPILIVVQTFYCFWMDRELDPMIPLKNRVFIYLWIVFVLITCTLDRLPFLWKGVAVIGNLALLGTIYYFSVLIRQEKRMRLREFLMNFMTLVIFALLLAGIYALINLWVRDDSWLFILNSLTASMTVFVLISPIRKWVKGFEKLLVSKSQRKQNEEQSQSLSAIQSSKSTQEVLREIEVLVARVYGIHKVDFYFLSNEGSRYLQKKSTGSSLDFKVISKDSPLIQFIGSKNLSDEQKLIGFSRNDLESLKERTTSKEQKIIFEEVLVEYDRAELGFVFGFYTQSELFGLMSLQTDLSSIHQIRKSASLFNSYLSKVALKLYRLETIEHQKEMNRLSTLGEMSAGLAHEIRNPLGAIKGAAQLLAKNDQMDSRFVRIILEETQRLNRVVTQFLDYSKPLKVQMREFDLIELCQEIVLLMNADLTEGIELIFESAVIEASVKGDPDQLKQVFINLLQNALRAVQAVHSLKLREAKIVFSVEKPPQSQYWLVKITDNGVGIKQEDLEKIFIPFYTTDLQGTGLGLPVSYRLIKAHEGEMKVDSEFGVGTRIEILLPKLISKQEENQ